jgi:hypothetical protein
MPADRAALLTEGNVGLVRFVPRSDTTDSGSQAEAATPRYSRMTVCL